jgi:hypothetical protein
VRSASTGCEALSISVFGTTALIRLVFNATHPTNYDLLVERRNSLMNIFERLDICIYDFRVVEVEKDGTQVKRIVSDLVKAISNANYGE